MGKMFGDYIVSAERRLKGSVVLKPQENRAGVHFIPDLDVGVFVILRAPEVINQLRVQYPSFGFSLKYRSLP
jgi:hypothetical protein